MVVGYVVGLGAVGRVRGPANSPRRSRVRCAAESGGIEKGKMSGEDLVSKMRNYTSQSRALENPSGTLPSHMTVEMDKNGEPFQERFVYVDEIDCIGCSHCAMVARNTFFLEQTYGRARAFQQDADPDELIEEAIDTCPVNCIYYVPYSDLVVLEGERQFQNINPANRLFGIQENRNQSKSTVMNSAKMRCENCPKRGCKECPLYGKILCSHLKPFIAHTLRAYCTEEYVLLEKHG